MNLDLLIRIEGSDVVGQETSAKISCNHEDAVGGRWMDKVTGDPARMIINQW